MTLNTLTRLATAALLAVGVVACVVACGPESDGTASSRPRPGVAMAATPDAATADTAPGTETPPAQREGREETVNGLRVIHVYGTPQEMGRQLGELTKDSVRFLLDEYLPNIPGARERETEATARAKQYAEHIPESQLVELRAMADAAGANYDHLLIGQCVIELYEETLCAAIGAWGDATADGTTIVGRNLDWYDGGTLHKHSMIVVRHPSNGRAFVSLGYPGMVGVVTGMNADGVFLADLVQMKSAHQTKPPVQVGIPVMALQRQVLEQAATLGQAVALITSAKRTVPHNYIVADATRAEFLETDSVVVDKRESHAQTVIGTNYAGESRAQAQMDFRFSVMCQCVDKVGGELASSHVEEALGRANLGKLSVQSVVAFPAALKLRVSMGKVPACKGPFVDVDAGALMEVSK